mmetsp:Transcript_21941/g.54303  ORF Transcript_21941/g.54303 Transcript_21941/m.54303 type:complete len:414 (+) Transcript_21941:410-1651(+)|eukprot:CAMPEP_0116088174 /NCGR_PEP_ID=MMETSP0327-20121206/5735_1 /TAXON_ID=44447 /ORGANISM="Pseudo-nitzschia delicatissima, Strain B596" /LENGTH=413 /DNA_ID=CAMNT_0003579249 /DNA_START=541 /DNA_END=1782 /DNA_ORIENTATION=+
MSERMIELQRAKLGLPPAGVTPTNAAQSATGKNGSSAGNAASPKQPSPTEVAKATLLSEDAQMERFINRLQRRDRKKAITHHHQMPSSRGPTVPSALSRRMLQRQGVGYLDETVASVVSASADRFLATVLQQSIACRDQRLKGAAMTREAAKQRKRHLDDYDADNDDRKRRKESIVKAREDIALITIEQGEPPKKGAAASGKSPTGTTKKGTKKKKGSRKAAAEAPTGPQAIDPKMIELAREASEDEYDSIDEEEEYYQENVEVATREKIRLKKSGDNDYDEEDEDVEEDEDDETLLLRDIVRPLEAWNFHLNGKVAIETDDENDEFENNIDAESIKTSTSVSSTRKEQQEEEKGTSYNEASSAAANGSESGRSPNSEKKPSVAPNGNKNGASTKTTAPSPTPTASSNPPTSS